MMTANYNQTCLTVVIQLVSLKVFCSPESECLNLQSSIQYKFCLILLNFLAFSSYHLKTSLHGETITVFSIKLQIETDLIHVDYVYYQRTTKWAVTLCVIKVQQVLQRIRKLRNLHQNVNNIKVQSLSFPLPKTSALLAKMYSSSPEVVLLNSNVTRVFAHFSIKDQF